MPKAKSQVRTVRENIFQDGPYLQAAVLCEKVLEEKDGTKTAVRIIDRVTHTVAGPQAPEHMPTFKLSAVLLIRFKKGEKGDKHQLKLELVNPAREVGNSLQISIQFEGGPDRGVDIVVPASLEFDREGVYWFDLYLDEFRVSRIPIRCVYFMQKQLAGGEAPKPVQ